MSVQAYSQYDNNKINKNVSYELWLLKKLCLTWVRFMGSYSCIARVCFDGVYDTFLLCYDDLYVDYAYDLCFFHYFHNDV